MDEFLLRRYVYSNSYDKDHNGIYDTKADGQNDFEDGNSNDGNDGNDGNDDVILSDYQSDGPLQPKVSMYFRNRKEFTKALKGYVIREGCSGINLRGRE